MRVWNQDAASGPQQGATPFQIAVVEGQASSEASSRLVCPLGLSGFVVGGDKPPASSPCLG